MTTNEELRSLNEELSAANTLLEQKVIELERGEDDINNLSPGTGMATVFLDTEMRIRHFAPGSARPLDLGACEAGQSLADLLPNLHDHSILDDAIQVLQDLVPVEKEVAGNDGRRYLRHIRPFRTEHNRVDGLVVNFIDISERKAMQLRLADREKRLAAILDALADGVVGASPEGIITEFNATAEGLFECPAHEAIGQSVQRFLQPGAAKPMMGDILHLLDGQIAANSPTVLCDGVRTGGKLFPAELRVSKIDDLGIRVLQVRDATHRYEQEQQIIKISNHEQQRIGKFLHEGLGQQLAGLNLLASILASKLHKAGRPESADAQELAHKMEQAFSDSKALIQGLSPVGVAPKKLVDALTRLTDEVSRTTGVHCEVHSETELRAADWLVTSHLYRIAQEAVNNAVAHGAPSHIDLRLQRREDYVCLSVHDDGSWADKSEESPRGLGMHIMSYRASILGGEIKVERPPEGGTLVLCEIPLTGHTP